MAKKNPEIELRDLFAAFAMLGTMSNEHFLQRVNTVNKLRKKDDERPHAYLAEACYSMADDMMRARAK